MGDGRLRAPTRFHLTAMEMTAYSGTVQHCRWLFEQEVSTRMMRIYSINASTGTTFTAVPTDFSNAGGTVPFNRNMTFQPFDLDLVYSHSEIQFLTIESVVHGHRLLILYDHDNRSEPE